MKRFFRNHIIILSFIIVLLLLFFLYGTDRVSAVDRNTYKSLKTFNEVLDMVEKNYVEEVKLQDLIQGAISGMMKSLDPHSTFMTAEEYKELEVETKGSFGGIGIEITLLKDVLTVVSPIEDTPAFQAGIKPGDQIIKIDGKSTKDITIQEAVKKLRGPKDTKVTITIYRESLQKPKDFVLTRAIIKITSVKSRLMDDGIGYCRIASFQERTGDDLKKAVKEMDAKANHLKGIVLDLRNNPGGLLNQSIEVSDVFLKSGMIVSTRGRIKAMDTSSSAKNDGDEPTCPIVVLINEGSASASEIVAGALQDNGRALILGTRSFGKGSVQTLIPLEDGAALKLTTAKYYTPSGRSIQAEGIAPDITLKYAKAAEETAEGDESLREQDLKGHIKSAKENGQKPPEETAVPPKKEAEEAAFVQDNQIKAAADILRSWHIFMKGKKN
ncbi:MAG TPA: S41 family peptidase [Syntrophales bacterium]|jgi:carboxyl-terminal processing protease|nr:S41 family peptidase [Syntrophales bacterium]HPX55738.1 S41 family peptidase [Syntrophales bacterium]HQA82505.1 S41 family peptidase [Syntrophales bacterium]